MNFLPTHLIQRDGVIVAQLAEGIDLPISRSRWSAYGPYVGRKVEIGLRPEHLTDRSEPLGPNDHYLEATIEVVEPTGATSLIAFSLAGREYTMLGDTGLRRRPGDRIRLQADMDQMHLIDPDNGEVVPVDIDVDEAAVPRIA